MWDDLVFRRGNNQGLCDVTIERRGGTAVHWCTHQGS